MILQTLCLLGGAGLASGQTYLHNHQQFFYEENPYEPPTRFDTKALTPVNEEGFDTVKWAFASTFRNGQDTNLLTMVVVKLSENLPQSLPYEFEWGFRYFDRNKEWEVDVEDIYHNSLVGNPPVLRDPSEWRYVVCGRIFKMEPEPFSHVLVEQGFVMTLNTRGGIHKRKRYPRVRIFKSIISIIPNNNNEGYIAVGQLNNDITNPLEAEDAVLVSLDDDLMPACALKSRGTFSSDGFPTTVRSQWNKVVPYKSLGITYYAVVGETKRSAPNCETNVDVLIGIFEAGLSLGLRFCSAVWTNQYGDGVTGSPETGEVFQERGLSIAEYLRSPTDCGVVIVGNTKKLRRSDCQTRFDDVLILNVHESGALVWDAHYAIEGSDYSLRDVGTAVKMSKYQKTILVAGETRTNYFQDDALLNPTTDAFLLEVDRKNGNLVRLDIFGLYDGIHNGALYQDPDLLPDPDPGNLDLHITPDEHAVIMGNAKIRLTSTGDYGGSGTSTPYLIEAYQTIQEKCYHARLNRPPFAHTILQHEGETKPVEIQAKRLQMRKRRFRLKQEIVCEKINLEPTSEPTTLEPTPE